MQHRPQCQVALTLSTSFDISAIYARAQGCCAVCLPPFPLFPKVAGTGQRKQQKDKWRCWILCIGGRWPLVDPSARSSCDVFRAVCRHAQARPAGEERRCPAYSVCCFGSGSVGAPGPQQHLFCSLLLGCAAAPVLHPWPCLCCCLGFRRIWRKRWRAHTA